MFVLSISRPGTGFEAGSRPCPFHFYPFFTKVLNWMIEPFKLLPKVFLKVFLLSNLSRGKYPDSNSDAHAQARFLRKHAMPVYICPKS